MISSDYAWIIDDDLVSKGEFSGFCGPVDANQNLVDSLKSNRFVGKRFQIIFIDDESGADQIAFKGRIVVENDFNLDRTLEAPLYDFSDSIETGYIKYRINREWVWL